MLDALERIVMITGDEITVCEIKNPRSNYSSIFRNKDTRELDQRFGLNGERLDEKSPIARDLRHSTDTSALGNVEAGRIMRYFAHLAVQAGHFVGVYEEEMLRNIMAGTIQGFNEIQLKAMLNYSFGNDGATYMKNVNVEGKAVLFPANLHSRRAVWR